MSKNDKFVAIKSGVFYSSSEYTKTRFRPGLRPGPRWGREDTPSPSSTPSSVVTPPPQHKFLATPMDLELNYCN